MVDQRPEATHIGGHHRHATGRSLQRHQPEGLGSTGHDNDVCRPIPVGEAVMGLRFNEPDSISQAIGIGQLVKITLLGLALCAAGPTDYHESGVGPAQGIEGPNGHVDALQGLDASRE